MNYKSLLNFFALFIIFHFTASGQEETKGLSIHKSLQEYTDEIFQELVDIRRDLHRNPEISGREQRTSEKIAEFLESQGLEVKTHIGGYGVVGILNGSKEGKSIAWRADIDAMPSNIPDVVDFESENPGVRHICGHDVHTAIGMGIAKVLARHKEQIEGTVYFIFQPAEETYEGAKAMIDDRLYEVIDADEIYGIHISPFPVGTIATKSGHIYAHTNIVEVKYGNTNNEEAKISRTKDWIKSFQNISPESKFWNLENLGDAEAGIESPNTVFKDFFIVKEKFNVEIKNDQLIITATLSTDNKSQLESFPVALEKKIKESEFSKDLVSVRYSYEKAVVINDEDLTQSSINSIKDIYGEKSIIPVYGIVTGDRGDDFAFFQKSIPGVYFYLGGANYETGVISMPHAPDFKVDEESIRFGVKYFSSMIVERVNE